MSPVASCQEPVAKGGTPYQGVATLPKSAPICYDNGMSSESRTLIVVLLIIGVLASCCMCVPIVAFIAAPAIIRVQEAAQRVAAKQEADRQLFDRAANISGPPKTVLPPAPPPRLPPLPAPLPPATRAPGPIVPEAAPATVSSEARRAEPAKARRPSAPSPATTADSGLRSLDAVTDSERRAIYRAATIGEQFQSSIQKQIAERRARGIDTTLVEKMLRERQDRHEQDLERLMRAFRVSREDLDIIIAEGKQKGW
jgi:hypothetical protein